MQPQPFRGVIAPVLTPFRPDLSPDSERFVDHCRWLLAQGCHGLAPFGTTSEGTSLSPGERVELLDAALAAGIDPGRLMPGTGSASLVDAVAMTRAAVERGCGGVLMLPPYYYKDVGEDGLFRFFAEVIERTGDSRLRLYLYHIPPQAVLGFSLSLVGRLLAAYPGVVAGIKDSSGDWENTRALAEAFPGFGVFAGSEVFLLPTLRAGGAGCITATANANPAAIRALYDRWQEPDADALHDEVVAVRRAVQSQPLIPALKHLIARARGAAGWETLRPPLVALDPARRAALDEALATVGFAVPPDVPNTAAHAAAHPGHAPAVRT